MYSQQQALLRLPAYCWFGNARVVDIQQMIIMYDGDDIKIAVNARVMSVCRWYVCVDNDVFTIINWQKDAVLLCAQQRVYFAVLIWYLICHINARARARAPYDEYYSRAPWRARADLAVFSQLLKRWCVMIPSCLMMFCAARLVMLLPMIYKRL